MNEYEQLLEKIKKKNAHIGIIGLGYVGLPLALLFAKKKFSVTGFVRSEKRKKALENGISHLSEKQIDKDLKKSLKAKTLSIAITSPELLQKQDIIIICVPTPVTHAKKPDLTDLATVADVIKKISLHGKLLINESTVAPGTTTKYFGAYVGKYFYACSPERVDPGISTKDTSRIPKVIGGIDKESSALVVALYSHIVTEQLVVVPSPAAAELAKMLENTYRAVNISLINEFAKIAEKLDIDILDVIRASSTKWSFQAHYPGIGVGGHCIPVDPYYIVDLASQHGIATPVIQHGLEENEQMPLYVAQKVQAVYQAGMRVLLYGLTYKKDVNDLRESPVIPFTKHLKQAHIPFLAYDPYVDDEILKQHDLLPGKIEQVDILIVGTDHTTLIRDQKKLIGKHTIVIDGKNFFKQKVGKALYGVGRTFA